MNIIIATVKKRETIVLFGIIIAMAIFSAINNVYFSSLNLRDILEQAVIFGLMGIGLTCVIITGCIDLSNGSILALSACLMGMAMRAGWSIAVAMAIAALTGIALGAINGLIVTHMKLQPFIATMGTMQVYRGISYVITQGIPVRNIPSAFRNLVYSQIVDGWLIRWSSIIFVVWALVIAFVLQRTKFGTHLYAVGGNEEAARLSGVKVERSRIGAYMISGLSAALAGIVMVGKLGTADPTAATGYEMNAIAGAVIGGTRMAGGQGTILGTFLGSILFSSVRIGLITSGLDQYWQFIATGVVIVVACYVEIAQRRIGE